MPIKDITIDELLESYDWMNVFADEGACLYNVKKTIQVIPPGSPISAHAPSRTDVAEIIAAVNGENDESDWVGVFLLQDGRYLVAEGGCDYTGWDCQAGNSLCVAATLDDAIRLGLTAEQQLRLGVGTAKEHA